MVSFTLQPFYHLWPLCDIRMEGPHSWAGESNYLSVYPVPVCSENLFGNGSSVVVLAVNGRQWNWTWVISWPLWLC
jgi:hypothetical protein